MRGASRREVESGSAAGAQPERGAARRAWEPARCLALKRMCNRHTPWSVVTRARWPTQTRGSADVDLDIIHAPCGIIGSHACPKCQLQHVTGVRQRHIDEGGQLVRELFVPAHIDGQRRVLRVAAITGAAQCLQQLANSVAAAATRS